MMSRAIREAISILPIYGMYTCTGTLQYVYDKVDMYVPTELFKVSPYSFFACHKYFFFLQFLFFGCLKKTRLACFVLFNVQRQKLQTFPSLFLSY